jgi:hypothetical protein
MIRVIDRVPEGVLGFEASGKLTADDYTQVLAPTLDAASAGSGRVRILLDFSGEFDGMEGGGVAGPPDGCAELECLGTHRLGHRSQVDARRAQHVLVGRPGRGKGLPTDDRSIALHCLEGS